jgi:hypothetical protein
MYSESVSVFTLNSRCSPQQRHEIRSATQRGWGVSCEAVELRAAQDEGEGVGDVIAIGSNSKGIPETEWVG